MTQGEEFSMAGTLQFSRRRILRGGAALGAFGMAGLCAGSCRPRGRAVRRAGAASARRRRHPQRLCHDHGAGRGDIANGDVHVKDGVIAAVGAKLDAPGRGRDRRRRHDRAAGPGRNPLAHVEHAAAQHVGRQARVRLFPHHRGARPEIRAGRHVPGHATCGRRGDQLRHHLRARLVPQYPRPRLCRGRFAGAARIGTARALLLRRRAGHAEQRRHRPRRSRAVARATGRSIPTKA